MKPIDYNTYWDEQAQAFALQVHADGCFVHVDFFETRKLAIQFAEELPDGKVCKGCGEHKPLAEYGNHKECKGGKVGTCKRCIAVRVDVWTKANREEVNRRARSNTQRKKLLAIEYMGGKCLDCKQVYHPSVYDFHHIGGKDMNPSKALSGSFEKAKLELDKCVLLCANCHRVRHYGG